MYIVKRKEKTCMYQRNSSFFFALTKSICSYCNFVTWCCCIFIDQGWYLACCFHGFGFLVLIQLVFFSKTIFFFWFKTIKIMNQKQKKERGLILIFFSFFLVYSNKKKLFTQNITNCQKKIYQFVIYAPPPRLIFQASSLFFYQARY